MMLAAGLFALAGLTMANDRIRVKDVEGTDAMALASRILPADVRGEVVEGAVKRQFLPGNVFWAGYLTKPTRVAEDMCARTQYSLQMQGDAAIPDTEMTIGPVHRTELRALIADPAPVPIGDAGCDAADGYVGFDGSPDAIARIAAYRTLANAINLARSTGPLPYTLRCHDEQPTGACASGGRAALASLSLKSIGSFQPIYNTSCLRTVFEYPEDHCPPGVAGTLPRLEAWEITLPYAAGGAFSWTIGLAPAEGPPAEIELRRGMIIFH